MDQPDETTTKWRKVKEKEDTLENETSFANNAVPSSAPQLKYKVNYGVLISLLSGICHSLSSLFDKLVPGVTLLQFGFYKCLLVSVFMFVYLKFFTETKIFSRTLRPNETKLLFLRGLVLMIGSGLISYARKHLPLGDTSALTGTSTIITGFLGLLFLGESWQLLDFLLSLVCLTGVVLISRPTFIFEATPQLDIHRTFDIIIALGAATFQSIALLLVRYLGRTLDTGRLVLFAFSIATGFYFIAMVTVDGVFIPNYNSWIYILLSGVVATCGHVLVSKGLKTEKAAAAAVAKSSGNVVTSFFFQLTIFGNIPKLASVIGALLIVTSATILSWIKTKRKVEKKQ